MTKYNGVSQKLFIAVIAMTTSISLAAKEPLLFPISVEGKWGYIDHEGKVVIQPQFLSA
ncbi:MAG: WG repeat-containing protein, partial [Planctomycetaceae bacterium]